MENVDAAAERLKALGHPVRLAIVRALAERSACCCADVCSRLPLAQSTVSQHLKVLKDAGLISFRRDGVRSSYVLNPAGLRCSFAATWRDRRRFSLAAMRALGARGAADGDRHAPKVSADRGRTFATILTFGRICGRPTGPI